jgi:uncharacterized delta-60 repeat protein
MGGMIARRPLRSAAALGVALLVALLFSTAAQAAAGDLDPTFSGDGKQTTDFPFGVSGASETVSQPDGKVIAVGSVLRATARDSGLNDFAIARYSPNGSLDPTFSGDGKQTTDFNGLDDQITDVALQSDGKIVVVGRTGFFDPFGSSFDFAVARYNANGSLDTSFSGDGKQTIAFGDDAQAGAVALQDDGKIVAVGRTCSGNPDIVCDSALARLNADGSPDTNFSTDGKQTTDFGSVREQMNGVALQADGKIISVGASGGSPSGAAFDFAVARYNTDGSLDPDFSGDGMQTTDFGTNDDRAVAVAVQSDGKIVAGGPGGPGAAFARYNTDGSLDTGFSGDGKKTTDFFSPSGLALQGDGKIMAVGGGAGGDFALARYNPDGTPDTTFSADGKQTTAFPAAAGAGGIALQGDGKIVAVGTVRFPLDLFALARYNADGSLDTSFSFDGTQTTSFGGFRDGAAAVAIQGDGKIVAAGHAGGISTDFALARYNPNGTLDTSFSGDGKHATDFGGDDQATAVAIQANGKIVVVGTADATNNPTFAIVRYNANGTLDTSFSGDGKQTTAIGFGSRATGVAIQANGKIIAVGSGGSVPGFALARYNPNGTLDTTFSADGKQTTAFANSDGATGVAIQPDGQIVAVGNGGASPGDFALARYSPNGTLDTNFSGDGKQTTDFGGTDAATGVAAQGNGKIVAVGRTATFSETDFALARYSPNGTLDATFSGDGKQTTGFAGGAGGASGIVLQGDGKVVAVGSAAAPAGGLAFALARYTVNGSLDLSFSGDGRQTTGFGEPQQFGGAYGAALQGDGKIVAAGIGPGPGLSDDFALARYLGG